MTAVFLDQWALAIVVVSVVVPMLIGRSQGAGRGVTVLTAQLGLFAVCLALVAGLRLASIETVNEVGPVIVTVLSSCLYLGLALLLRSFLLARKTPLPGDAPSA